MFPLVSGVVMLCHGPEFLLLFWGQDLTEVMPQREMRQPEVHLFGGDGLERIFPAHGGERRTISEGYLHSYPFM